MCWVQEALADGAGRARLWYELAARADGRQVKERGRTLASYVAARAPTEDDR